jgi:hypothetical protein
MECITMRKNFRYPVLSMITLTLLSLSLSLSSVAHAYDTDLVNHVVTVTPNTDLNKTTTDLRAAFTYLVKRTDQATPWTLKLNPGQFVLASQISTNGLQNTTITSADLTQPAQLIKKPGWDSATSAEYILYNSMCNHVTMTGVEFYGQTSFAGSAEPYWPDQGVYFGSCNVLKIDQNKFFNFGNSALRVSTWERDPVVGVDSFKTLVSNNVFNNFYQTTTTVQDNIHGGTAMSTWINNTFTNVHGSVKFASRTPGASNIEFFNNLIDTGEHFGLEINNYSNFSLKGNTIRNIGVVAMNIYTGAIPGFPWGDNFTIANNTIDNVGRGIRFCPGPGSDGFQYNPQNLVIDNNTLSNVHDEANQPAIMIINGNVNGVTITNNKMNGITDQKYISVTSGSTNVNVTGNLVDGMPYILPGTITSTSAVKPAGTTTTTTSTNTAMMVKIAPATTSVSTANTTSQSGTAPSAKTTPMSTSTIAKPAAATTVPLKPAATATTSAKVVSAQAAPPVKPAATTATPAKPATANTAVAPAKHVATTTLAAKTGK